MLILCCCSLAYHEYTMDSISWLRIHNKLQRVGAFHAFYITLAQMETTIIEPKPGFQSCQVQAHFYAKR